MNKSLYAITDEFNATMEKIMESGGEITGANENDLKNIEILLREKTDSIVGWVQSQNDLIELARNRIEELENFIGKIATRLEKFDGYVNNCFAKMNTTAIDGNMCSIVKRRPSKIVAITDESLIPLDFIKIPEPKAVIQKAEIAKVLKSGEEVPGAALEDSLKISISYKLK